MGIVAERPFSSGKLVRPLLSTSKQEIKEFAERYQVKFFEDASNQSSSYQRNRIRHNVLPQLKAENPKAVEHLSQFSQQLVWASELIEKQMAVWYQKNVTRHADGYYLKTEALEEMSEGELYFFWEYFFQESLKKEDVGAKQRQIDQLLQLFKVSKSQWQLSFGEGWVLKKEYQQLFFSKRKQSDKASNEWIVLPDKGIYLSENQWLIVAPKGEGISIPSETAGWSEFSQDFFASNQTSFQVRKRCPGDRILLQRNLYKRISRYFIDKKIPSSEREKSWLLLTNEQTILAIIPYVFSYLSNAEETDTIQYTLIYRYKDEALIKQVFKDRSKDKNQVVKISTFD